MLQQQINLYPHLTQQHSKIGLSVNRMLLGYVALISFLLLQFFSMVFTQHKQSVELKKLEITLEKNKKQLMQLISDYPQLSSEELRNTMTQLQRELDIKQKMVSFLSGKLIFSDILKGLSAASLPGAWFTEIIVANNGQSIDLKGQALKPGIIQQLLDRLQEQPVFSKKSFDLKDVTQVTDIKTNVSQYLNFLITNRAFES